MRILLIEDEPRIRAFIARGLGAEGFTVDETDDGQFGLSRALEPEYTLVILDLTLPSMDGLAVLRALSGRRPQLPVLVLSACSDRRTKLEALSLGASGYLQKPFAFGELLARVRNEQQRATQTACAAGAR
jgi:DNA-binding response OmpR family regulator